MTRDRRYCALEKIQSQSVAAEALDGTTGDDCLQGSRHNISRLIDSLAEFSCELWNLRCVSILLHGALISCM